MKKRLLIALVLVLALAATASLVWASGGLVSYWPFDEATGTTAIDAADGNNGTINGNAAYAGGVGIAPIAGNVDALTFDGVDDFVEVAHSDNLDMTGAYAISAWVKVDDVPNNIYRPILFRGTTDANDIEVYVQALSQDLVVAHNRLNGGTFDHVRFADPPIGTLFHLGVTFNGTDVQAYYNAVPATVNQNTTAMIAPLDTNKGWWIGKVDHAAFGTLAGGADINLFKGLIDEVRIYDRALSATEIEALADYSNFTVSLAPATDFNPVGTDHTVTATLDPALSFIPVLFEVTEGPNDGVSGTASTDGTGQATFTYTGDGGDGIDTIKACIDVNNSGHCDEGDQLATVTKTWFENFVTGGGKINVDGSRKAEWTFGGTVGCLPGLCPVGQFQIVNHTTNLACHFDTFSDLSFNGDPTASPPASHNTAMFTALGTCDDSSTPTITVTIEDNAEPGTGADTINVSGGLTFGGTINGGNFQVHDIVEP